ncbi:MAG: arylsulfatase [bacterium]
MQEERPNILLIMTDQHRGDCLSLMRHPVVQTPNLDTIGGSGAAFSRCYSTCPSCIPARRSLLSGQFPATHGMVGFSDGAEWHPSTTLPEELRQAGYQTALIGRTMHQWPRNKGFGFEHQNLVVGGDGQFPTERELAIAKQHPADGTLGGGAHGIDGNGWVARPWHLDESLHAVHWTVTEAIKWLWRRDPTRPYFLVVSFNPPHPPSVPPAHYLERYLAMALPEPVIGEWAERPEDDGLGLPPASHRCVLEGERARNAQAGYYGAINYVDDQVGRLLGSHGGKPNDALHNTIIAHTSDHGEMLGDHYMFRKCWPYEGSARVPFMIKGPGIQRRVRHDHPVCLEDLMPTLLDLVGLEIPNSVDGQSLAPILRGESEVPVRPYLHGEHSPCYDQDHANHYLVDRQWKYVWFPHDGREQLFHLTDDPQERFDRANDPAYAATLRQWRQRLVEQLQDRPEGFVAKGELVAGRPYETRMSHVSQEWGGAF